MSVQNLTCHNQGCTNARHLSTQVTKFCVMAHNILSKIIAGSFLGKHASLHITPSRHHQMTKVLHVTPDT